MYKKDLLYGMNDEIPILISNQTIEKIRLHVCVCMYVYVHMHICYVNTCVWALGKSRADSIRCREETM